jgi:penicillin-binding protein 2
MRDEARERQKFERRLRWLGLLVLAVCAVLLASFFYHQILRREYYFQLAENNRLDRLVLRPARGQIRDSNQRLLATNRTAYEVWADPAHLRPKQARLLLSRMVSDGAAVINRALEVGTATRISEDISFANLAYIEARRLELPGVEVRERRLRYYTYGATGAHLLGYVGEVTAAQLNSSVFEFARPGDVVGQLGLERSYDRLLRGTPGFVTVVVDHLGRQVDTVDRQAAIPGSDLELHLDLELQDAAEALLGEQAGAVVALDPRSGAVLAMASHPAFSPNQLVEGLRQEEWKQLGSGSALLFNRAIQSELPPGSVFKLVVAATALEEGVITPYTVLHCSGGITKGDHFFHCTRAHGDLNLRGAITVSCNSFFYQLGDRLGRERMVRGALRLGLGHPTRIDLPFERSGALPLKSWLERSRQGRWYGGDNLTLAIGQGPVLVTPLQLANLAAMIANGGTLYRPQIVQRIGTEPELAPVVLRGSTLQHHNLAAIREGMWGAVNSGGTAWRAAVPEGVAGKTGSAQVVTREKQKEGEGLKEHSWFIGFAPYAAPRIAIAVVLENAGEGGKAAAPLAQEVFTRFFALEARRLASAAPEASSPTPPPANSAGWAPKSQPPAALEQAG